LWQVASCCFVPGKIRYSWKKDRTLLFFFSAIFRLSIAVSASFPAPAPLARLPRENAPPAGKVLLI
jgi:hypothetical protein